MEFWPEYGRFFTALLVILDPFAAIPIFLSLTPGYSTAERKRIARVAALTVVAGLIMALSMLRAQPDRMRPTAVVREL